VFLLAEVLLTRALHLGVLPMVEEMVLVVSGLLEKREKIPPGSVTSEEGRCCYSLALRLCSGTLGAFSLWLARLGGIGSHTSGLCRCVSMLIQQ